MCDYISDSAVHLSWHPNPTITMYERGATLTNMSGSSTADCSYFMTKVSPHEHDPSSDGTRPSTPAVSTLHAVNLVHGTSGCRVVFSNAIRGNVRKFSFRVQWVPDDTSNNPDTWEL